MTGHYSRIDYDSVGALVRDATAFGIGDSAAQIDEHVKGAPHSSGQNPAFYNGYDWKRLERALANPPAELLGTVDRLRERITDIVAPVQRVRRIVNKQEFGEELSPLAWIQRDPDGWTDIRAAARPKSVVTIGVNLTVTWKQRPDDLLYRGAAAAALSDILEARGHSVEIVAFSVSKWPSDDTHRQCMRVCVKASDAPLDIGAVAFALSEIAFYRLAVLAAGARHARGPLASGWGKCDELHADERAGIDILAERDINTEAAAVAWIERHCAAESADAASTA